MPGNFLKAFLGLDEVFFWTECCFLPGEECGKWPEPGFYLVEPPKIGF